MKCRVLKAVFLAALTGTLSPALAQKNYYVVVGAFSTDTEAREFTTHLPGANSDTIYAMNNQDNVYQLYVLQTANEQVAIAKSKQLQNNLDDVTQDGILGNYETVSIANSAEGNTVVKKSFAPLFDQQGIAEASSSRSSAPNNASLATAAMRPKGKLFKFTISDMEGRNLPGNIHYIDLARERDVATYSTATYTDLQNPGKDAEMALVAGVFGYKPATKYVDYGEPSTIEGAYQDENGAWVIPYELERLEKGDVSVMYNVAFHKDAVIMLPHAKTDLDELVKMMNENPHYEITIHGHCNGKNDRKITALSKNLNFFDVTDSELIYGSAKDLASYRADAVLQYLVQNGISAKRIKTYAWGGKYMIAEPDGPFAKLNDRIEIEIRKD